jgi:hypothetical protein
MSLHKQLAEAFGGRRVRRIGRPADLTPLEDQSFESAETIGELRAPVGFDWRRVDFVLVIGAAGEAVEVERPPWRMRGKRSRSSMLVPQRQLKTQGGFSGFLWGTSVHALGLRRSGARGEVRPDPEAFNCFRIFHRAVLANTRDPSLRAFAAFLNNWRPEIGFEVPDLAPLVGGSLAFRFQYDEQFLHETHAARLIWRRLLGSNGALQEPDEAA